MNVWMVIAGDPAIVEVDPGTTLRALCETALGQTRQGDVYDEWELRDVKGALLDLNASVESFGLKWPDRWYLNRRAGVGA